MTRLLPLTAILTVLLFAGEAWAQDGGTKSQRFRDDFTGDDLNPSWEIGNEKHDHWTLLDKDYLFIISSAGSINIFFSKYPLPSRFAIEIKFTADLKGNNCNFGQPVGNRMVFGLINKAQDTVVMAVGPGLSSVPSVQCPSVSFEKGSKNTTSSLAASVALTGEFKLRIVKGDVDVEGSYDFGQGWVSLGKHYVIGFDDARMIFFAFDEGQIAETGVRVDYVEMVPQ